MQPARRNAPGNSTALTVVFFGNGTWIKANLVVRPLGPTLSTRSWSPALRYICTIVLFGATIAIGLLWRQAADHPFFFLLTYVVVCSVFFDRAASLLATALSASLLAFLLAYPRYAIGATESTDIAGWLAFVAVCLFAGTLIDVLHKALSRLNESNQALTRANQAISTAEREKDLLLREAAHRMRNDLTRLIAIIDLEQRSADSAYMRERLSAIADRVRVMARVQNRLVQADGEAFVDMRDYLTDLCSDLHSSVSAFRAIKISAHSDPHSIRDTDAVVVGLITNELVTNALKHAFPDKPEGNVWVTFRAGEEKCLLSIEDDGIGISADPDTVKKGHSLGQTLIRSLVSQLEGTYELRPRQEGPGTTACITFQPGRTN